MKHIVRIAPSPTGQLHIGTLRTAYFNWLIANQNDDSQLIVRIDDTDLARSQDDLIQPIYDTLTDYGMNWDVSYRQSTRFDSYQFKAQQLINSDLAIRKDGAVMLKAHGMDFDWVDTITGPKHTLSISPDQYSGVTNQVIIKSDGSPTYNFASAVDDMDSGVTWVVRGTDHILNTYKQVIFYKLFSKPLPLYSHVGLVCHSSGKKFSKRDSDALDLSQYSKDAVLNYILRLGWSPRQDDKSNNIIPVDKAIQLFLDGGKMRAPNCKFDLMKLQWYNKKYKHGYKRD